MAGEFLSAITKLNIKLERYKEAASAIREEIEKYVEVRVSFYFYFLPISFLEVEVWKRILRKNTILNIVSLGIPSSGSVGHWPCFGSLSNGRLRSCDPTIRVDDSVSFYSKFCCLHVLSRSLFGTISRCLRVLNCCDLPIDDIWSD